MGKIAFVFSGQGAQYPGMGMALAQSSKAAAAVFQTADSLRPGTSAQCFSADAATLRETANTQPCMFAVEMAAAAALTEAGLRADMAAGFSLGELAALTYAQSVDFETGFQLVCRRGALMQEAALQQSTAMAAVLRLPEAEVERICAGLHQVCPVNYNCPGQIAVSGPESQMPALFAAVKAAGGRAVPLNVAGGFHSPFMAGAAEAFARFLNQYTLIPPALPLYANCTGAPYEGDLKKLLANQIRMPVRWEKTVRSMIAAGADTFVELGPGQTLCGLIRKTDSGVRTFSVSDPAGLETVLTEVKAC